MASITNMPMMNLKFWLKIDLKSCKIFFNKKTMHNFNTCKSRFLFLLYAVFFFLILRVFSVQAAPSSPLLLFYSGNVQGETEPCG